MEQKDYPLDPAERLDFVWDWAKALDNEDTIAQSEFTSSAGVTTELPTMALTFTRVWVKDAQPGLQRVTNKITTAQGRVFRRSLTIRVGDN